MTEFIINRILPPQSDPKNPQVRQHCGTMAGVIGILLNLFLCGGKLIAGLFTGSIAVIADAINNLSDAAASVVTLVGFRLAGQSADEDHPFGHGRIEYLAGLLVALAILMMGFEIAKTSVEKLFNPTTLTFSWLAIAMLALSILVKLWMYAFNGALGQKIASPAMAATAADSHSDAVSTLVVLVATLADHFFHLSIDALAGLLVAAFILKAGWGAVKDTIDPLLGRAMDPELAKDIDRVVLEHPNILGMHDLIYHDYGPGRAMMSFHAEVPADGDFMELHDIIDHIERELKETHGIETVIHMDPVLQDGDTALLRQEIALLAKEIDERLSIHDFRITPGPIHTNLIFDLVVPHTFSLSDYEVSQVLTQSIRKQSERYYPVFEVERSYVSHGA